MEVNIVKITHDALWVVIISLKCLIQRLKKEQVILSNNLENWYFID